MADKFDSDCGIKPVKKPIQTLPRIEQNRISNRREQCVK